MKNRNWTDRDDEWLIRLVRRSQSPAAIAISMRRPKDVIEQRILLLVRQERIPPYRPAPEPLPDYDTLADIRVSVEQSREAEARMISEVEEQGGFPVMARYQRGDQQINYWSTTDPMQVHPLWLSKMAGTSPMAVAS